MPRLIRIVAPLGLLMLGLLGCTAPANNPPVAVPAPAPREVRISGSGTALPTVRKLASAYAAKAPDVRLVITDGTNSGGAIKGVLQGTLEVAVANRPLSEAEQAEPLSYHPYLRDAVAFATNRPNPVTGLSAAQLRDIYAGSVLDWAQVGGAAGPIVVLDRDPDESMRKLALLRLMDGRPVGGGAIPLTSAGDMLTSLEGTPGAIGYSSLGLLRMRSSETIGLLAIDGVVPGPEALASGAYPWHLTFGLAIHRDAPAEARHFVEFALQTAPALLGEFGYAAP